MQVVQGHPNYDRHVGCLLVATVVSNQMKRCIAQCNFSILQSSDEDTFSFG